MTSPSADRDETRPPWQPYLDDVRARIAAFVADGRTEPVLGPDALVAAERLWTSARGSHGDVPAAAALAVASLYWHRSQAAPRPPADDEDLGAAIGIYAMIAVVDAEAVPPALRSAVAEARQLTALRGAGDGGLAADIMDAVNTLRATGSRGNEDRLQEVITRFRALLRDCRPQLEAYGYLPAVLSNLGLALKQDAVTSGRRAAVEEAVTLTRQALDLPANPADRAALLDNASGALGTRFSWTGAVADLREAIGYSRQAEAMTDRGDPAWAVRASNLSALLRVRFDARGDQADLDQAVTLSRAAAELTAPEEPGRGLHWSNASNALAARFQIWRERQDLDEAIAAGRMAVDSTPPGHPARGAILANVANLLLTRFEQWGGTEDVNEAIQLGSAALAAGDVGGPARSSLWANLSDMYRQRYERRGNPLDLDVALAMSEEALELSGPDDAHRASVLSDRSMILLTRHERQPEPAVLAEALRLGREAVTATGEDRPRRSKALSNLAILLAAVASSGTGGAAARAGDEAVRAAESAVATLAPDDPAQAIRLVNLASTRLDRFRRGTGTAADCQQAMAVYRRAASIQTAPVAVRIQAARGQASAARDAADWPAALDGYAAAIALLSRLVTRGITRRSREQLLARNGLLARDAAACALTAGSPERAVELLEHGRAVLWSQNLETTPSPALAAVQPDLANRLAAVATALG